jgi:uncharacterized protein (TIGR02246 family)
MRNAIAGVLLLCLAACAQSGGTAGTMMPAADLKARIDANNAAWVAAANKGDAASVGAMYTENATMLPPGMDIQRGHPAIEKTIMALGQSGVRNFSLASVDLVQVGPDTAREIGRLSAEVPGPKKKWIRIEGKYVVIWKLIAGKWLLDVDIWNLNK